MNILLRNRQAINVRGAAHFLMYIRQAKNSQRQMGSDRDDKKGSWMDLPCPLPVLTAVVSATNEPTDTSPDGQ